MKHQDETLTLAAAADGDPSARRWIVERWSGDVYRVAYRFLKNEHDARDLTQDVFVRVFQNFERFNQKRSFKTWILSITRNACIDELRRKRRHGHTSEHELSSPAPEPVEALDLARKTHALNDALTDLSEAHREIVTLFHFEHCTYAQIAEILDIPMGTVMNRLFRARKKLRDSLQQRGLS